VKTKKKIPAYRNSMEHISDELLRLDMLLRIRVAAFRIQTGDHHDPEAQQLYIHDREIDRLLDPARKDDGRGLIPAEAAAEVMEREQEIQNKVAASAGQNIFLGLPALASMYGLSMFEKEAVIICLAPELDPGYRRIYAYLQDDISLQYPTADFITRLVCHGRFDHWNARPVFSRHSRLLRSEILQPVEGRENSGWQRRGFRLTERVAHFLLGVNMIDDRLAGICRIHQACSPSHDEFADADGSREFAAAAERHFSSANSGKKIVYHFYGPSGAGKLGLSISICRHLGCPLIVCDMGMFRSRDNDIETILKAVFREGLLMQAGVYLEHLDELLNEPERSSELVRRIAVLIEEAGWLVFLGSEKPMKERIRGNGIVLYTKGMPVAGPALRKRTWQNALSNMSGAENEEWAELLASRFRLTPGRIRDCARAAKDALVLSPGGEADLLPRLLTACREQSNQRLRDMSLKIEPRYGWDDIILPDPQATLLREICAQVMHRERVYGDWGFESKFSHGKGLSVLFSGPPGTGKTMAAEVISRELSLDLYKIDLSGVVSKYIGETEKNLNRIFEEAETANAILFFDEADALFGKRTEVSDSHDRYANIEISYLLQKMEEYDGVVILASNLRQNIDEAFVRRIRFIVEFPFPDEESRRRIWQSHFPAAAPVSGHIDFNFLSREFHISGGHIRNIVLNAAFLAAGNGSVIKMDHVLRSVKQEYVKLGAVWNDDVVRNARQCWKEE
jgi:hypothetical protein